MHIAALLSAYFQQSTTSSTLNPFLEYLLSHTGIIGWPAVVYFVARACYRIGRFFSLLESRLLDGEDLLTTMARRDIPDIKTGIVTMTGVIQGLRSDQQIRSDMQRQTA